MSKSPTFSLTINAFFDDFQLVIYIKWTRAEFQWNIISFSKKWKGIELLKIQHTAPSGAIWRLVFGGLNNKRLIWVFVRSSVNELCFFFSFNSFQSLISHNWIRCKISCVAIKFEFFVWFFLCYVKFIFHDFEIL